jgi:hypothetical protein
MKEKECLIGSYNIYKWKGYRYEGGKPVVMLKVVSRHGNVELKNGKLQIKGNHGDFPSFFEKFMKVVQRDITPQELHETLAWMVEYYRQKEGKDLEWLNAPSLESVGKK